MNSALQTEQNKTAAISFQDTSMDIWDKKYRLKSKTGEVVDETMDDTYKRVARALADVENEGCRDTWYEQFLWALRRGAVPAGRIISNAGAMDHKPATSTINCTVSGSIRDSMHEILDKVHEAGLTLKAGCGIGYEFSTLRPKGAYVTGAGAYTSGPLSFMDIYDKMCFTVSSAGGRRGAQMGTFDVGHPDVMDFIRAKREDGRLRQFNLSLLISDDFMRAVKNDEQWTLAFPLDRRQAEQEGVDLDDAAKVLWRDWPVKDGYLTNDRGEVACVVSKILPARRLWDMIMASTYDFSEPGFVLIDRVNEMNNNWFAEDIRATNPCVTADTWVHTGEGPRQVANLLGRSFSAVVDGRIWRSGNRGFFKTGEKPVVALQTSDGYRLRLTADHKLRRVVRFEADATLAEWCPAGELRKGDRVMLNDHRAYSRWTGDYSRHEGYLAGLARVSGSQVDEGETTISVYRTPVAINAPYTPIPDSVKAIMGAAMEAANVLAPTAGPVHWQDHLERGEYRLTVPGFDSVLYSIGFSTDNAAGSIERTSSEFQIGFLRACFDVQGEVHSDPLDPSIVLSACDDQHLNLIQRMLLRLGIASRRIRSAANDEGKEILSISGSNLARFATVVGLTDKDRNSRLLGLLGHDSVIRGQERFTARVESVCDDGIEAVYDCRIPGVNAFDANGIMAHNCGEQPLPPYGSCLLGSVNLTKFVVNPFTDAVQFDWDEFHKVVTVFTRMLDNVVEINGLPLEGQRQEIERKRRHGMGFLGLGSTITMLRMKYGSAESVEFTDKVARKLALAGWEVALDLAREKGPAPIMNEEFTITPAMLKKRPEMGRDGWRSGDTIPGRILHARYSRYMQRLAEVAPELVKDLERVGARFTHHSSIAPTGTISLSLANNASNGIEPSFAHHYFRNVIREGKKTKEKVGVYSYEFLAYRQLVNANAELDTENADRKLPDYFVTADSINPKEHVDIQAAAQQWVDSSISKTANVPTDFPYEDFKDIYMYAYEHGLKGCTTFRFNPEAFQGVLVKENDLKNTSYTFVLDDGTEMTAKGDDEIEYDGEIHSAANLFDALKEGYYGKFESSARK